MPFATRLPDVPLDELDTGRSRTNPKPAGHASEAKLEEALLPVRLDVRAALAADEEGRAVDWLAVETDVERQRVAARASTEPVPHDFVARGDRRLPGHRAGHEPESERRNGEDKARSVCYESKSYHSPIMLAETSEAMPSCISILPQNARRLGRAIVRRLR